MLYILKKIIQKIFMEGGFGGVQGFPGNCSGNSCFGPLFFSEKNSLVFLYV